MPDIKTPVTTNKTSHQKTMKISRKSKKGRQCNDQKKKDKDLQNTTQETNDWATTNPTKTRGELRCSGRISSSYSTSDTGRITVKLNEGNRIWKSYWRHQYSLCSFENVDING